MLAKTKGNITVEELLEINKKLQSEIELLENCVDFYAYPKHEDGDRAYIFGTEARAALEKLKEIRGGE